MASQRTLRNITIVATVLALAIATGIIVWDAVRPLPNAERDGSVLAGKKPIDVSAAEKLVGNASFSGLIELAPPPIPVRIGNRNPFFVKEEKK